ncbi:sensor histidine kinase [Brevibacterium salitolerans]|uniref:Signal transduction histidine kinase subgroup 3 dimerisation and phosphoacceptor domain-containing protein n=1 Tax=Brevibacterium salitolerans TaxID=1403566 RepID=A0ABP5IN00_9MICO
MAATVTVTALTAPGLSAALLVVPSLALAALLLFWREPAPKLIGITALTGFVTFAWAAVSGGNAAGSAAAGICAGVWLVRKPGSRARWATVVLAMVASSALAFLGDLDTAIRTATLLLLMAGIWVASILDAEQQRQLVLDLERAKDQERELSILRERDRFAGDLHDIQGHSLHAIKLKAAVSAQLLTTDIDAAVRELDEVRHLAAEAIAQGRRLANATHTLDLAAEIHNARELLLSVGVKSVDVDAAIPPDESPHASELAQTLREAVTNIVRHAKARSVEIAIAADRMVVRNDGVPGSTPARPPLRGLGCLAERVARSGGELSATADNGVFTVEVSFTDEGAP